MPAGADWSTSEVQATVLDYMAMLKCELTGQTYNKTAHRQALLAKLDDRTSSAVELKHQNISAVLRDMGHFWIPGYKPRSNYQLILAEAVASWISADPELDHQALAAAESPVASLEHFDFTSFQVTEPSMQEGRSPGVQDLLHHYGARVRIPRIRDYAAREAHNASLGRAGEDLVVKFEQFRLADAGRPQLAAKVEHVAKTQGDGLGFDVLSFDLDGQERYIEVKTTKFAKETPFFASASEVQFARQNAEHFSLYRLFEFRRQPKCYTLLGSLEAHCALDPFTFRCSFS